MGGARGELGEIRLGGEKATANNNLGWLDAGVGGNVGATPLTYQSTCTINNLAKDVAGRHASIVNT